jgi:hypothetical protein
MISDEEYALWRAAVEIPAQPSVLEAYADWLLAHDRRRGELLQKNLRNKLSLDDLFEQSRLWEAAFGVAEVFRDVNIDPVSRMMSWYAERIGEADAILDRAPFLEVQLRFLASTNVDAVFASPVIAKIRRLGFWAYTERYEPGEAGTYDRETDYYGDKVLEALCASSHLAGLESLTVYNHEIGSRCATLLAAARFAHLRRLSIVNEKIGDEGARVLAGSAVVKGLRYLSLHGCGISSAGALALAESLNLGELEELWLHNNPIGTAGAAALRSSKNLSSLRTLEVGRY